MEKKISISFFKFILFDESIMPLFLLLLNNHCMLKRILVEFIKFMLIWQLRDKFPPLEKPSSSIEAPLCPWNNSIWSRTNIIFDEKPTRLQKYRST